MVKIIAVIGSKNSGKTTVIEYLISKLSKEGYLIGTIKHVHKADFSMDTKGKDSWKHAQAGAKVISIVSQDELTVIRKDSFQMNLEEVLKNMGVDKLDIIFIEGLRSIVSKRIDIFKIFTAKNKVDLEKLLKDTKPPKLAITGIVAKDHFQILDKIPTFDLQTEGDKLVELIKTVCLK